MAPPGGSLHPTPLHGVILVRNPGSRTEAAPFLRFFHAGKLFRKSELEAHHDWLGLETNPPDFLHAILDLFFQSNDVGGGSSAAIDDGEGMLGGDADALGGETFGKAGALD